MQAHIFKKSYIFFIGIVVALMMGPVVQAFTRDRYFIQGLGPIYPRFFLFTIHHSPASQARHGWWMLRPDDVLNLGGLFYSEKGKLMNRFSIKWYSP